MTRSTGYNSNYRNLITCQKPSSKKINSIYCEFLGTSYTN